jgi:hypothetical protein
VWVVWFSIECVGNVRFFNCVYNVGVISSCVDDTRPIYHMDVFSMWIPWIMERAGDTTNTGILVVSSVLCVFLHVHYIRIRCSH